MEIQYIRPAYFTDSDHPEVIRYAEETAGAITSPADAAAALFRRIRDEFAYSPYHIDFRRPALKASWLLGKKSGFCIQKALLLSATCRALGIPSRLRFFIVRNHIGTGKLEEISGTDLVVFHGAAELLLEGEWRKAVPAFDQKLCAKLGVPPLEFDGHTDAIFQEYLNPGEQAGQRRFMEYVHDYGAFADFPYELALSELKKHYPAAFDETIPAEERIAITHWE
jgi:transglutaminase-like putative cysteine protease